jgi:hypothetical protein
MFANRHENWHAVDAKNNPAVVQVSFTGFAVSHGTRLQGGFSELDMENRTLRPSVQSG